MCSSFAQYLSHREACISPAACANSRLPGSNKNEFDDETPASVLIPVTELIYAFRWKKFLMRDNRSVCSIVTR